MSRAIRVLHVTFNMGIGGTEQVIRQLVLGLPRQQVINEVLCIDGHIGPIGELLQAQDVPVTSVQRQPGFDLNLIKAIRSRLREGKFDIVHCHQYTPYLYGWLAALGTPAKVVFTEHGRFHPDRYRYKAALINPIMALLTPAVVAISSATRDALARFEFMPKGKIQVIYNGIAPLQREPEATARLRKELGIPEDAFVVGTVSRLDPVKNQAMMLRAFKLFLDQCPRGWLLMVGDGPDRQMLETLAQELSIAHRMTFTGFIKAPANHLAMMEVFLLSSHTEGTSMTLLEAMSLGIPAIVTNVGGNGEIVKPTVTGLTVPADNDRDFANALVNLEKHVAMRTDMSKASFNDFKENFLSSKMIEKYHEVYCSIIRF
ncbi:MAG: glycosyltransferase [Marinobacter sp.]|nr:glycosyltransferase [Marinobacter sp.]